MGLFSFLSKNKQETTGRDSGFYSADEQARSKRASHAGAGAARVKDTADPVLPEKKRARRRLVGAIALALGVAVGLPMVLDSEPKPLATDIAIQIPSKDKPATADHAASNPSSKVAASAALDQSEEIVTLPPKTAVKAPAAALAPAPAELPDAGPKAARVDMPPAAPKAEPKAEVRLAESRHETKPEPKYEAKPEPKHEAKPEPKHEAKPEPKHEAKPEPKHEARMPEPKPAEAKHETKAPEPKPAEAKREPKLPEPKQAEQAKPKLPEPKPAEPAKPASDATRALAILEGKPAAEPAATKYVVQIAALANQDKIDELQGKLKEAGIKFYTQKVPNQAGDRTRIRVGPFGSKEEAEKMRARLIKAGLSGSLVPA